MHSMYVFMYFVCASQQLLSLFVVFYYTLFGEGYVYASL